VPRNPEIEELIQLLFEEGRSNGIGIRVGLPYDEGWWKVLSGKGTRRVSEFLDRTQAVCMDTLNNSRWPDQAGFRGWYLPYELDQYNWATPERRELLVPWLSMPFNFLFLWATTVLYGQAFLCPAASRQDGVRGALATTQGWSLPTFPLGTIRELPPAQ
jgi:hypothetical protein